MARPRRDHGSLGWPDAVAVPERSAMPRSSILSLALVLTAPTAAAGPVDGDLIDGLVVVPNDTVSFRLFAVQDQDTERSLLTAPGGGPATVRFDSDGELSPIGSSTAGSFQILAGMREFFDNEPNDPTDGVTSRIRLTFETSDGSSFVDPRDFAEGFQFIRWEVGDHASPADAALADAIDFRAFVTQAIFVDATVVFFEDNTVLNTLQYGFTLGPGEPWNGTDAVETNIFSLDSQANRVEITYDYIPTGIPAPGGVALLTGGGLMLVRRRR
jgi:hypothetical protein